jgi:hypothetical protein
MMTWSPWNPQSAETLYSNHPFYFMYATYLVDMKETKAASGRASALVTDACIAFCGSVGCLRMSSQHVQAS